MNFLSTPTPTPTFLYHLPFTVNGNETYLLLSTVLIITVLINTVYFIILYYYRLPLTEIGNKKGSMKW